VGTAFLKMTQEFEGKEAYWWLINLEQHFEAIGILDEEKIRRVAKAMQGRDFVWWFVWKGGHPIASWWDFEKALI